MIHLAKHAFRNPDSRVLTAVAGPSPGNPLGIAGCLSFSSATDRLVNLQEHLRNILNVLRHRRVIRSLLAQAIVCLLLQRHHVSRTKIKTQGRSSERGKKSRPKPNNITPHAPDFIVQACAHAAGESFMVEYTFWKLTAFSKKSSKDMGCKCLGAHPKTALQRCTSHN